MGGDGVRGTGELEPASGVELTFVVVNWNAGRYLPAFFSSLREEAGSLACRVVLVDNGSTDDSLSYVRSRHPEVEVIESGGNRGFAGGNNIGIRAGEGRYLCLVNPDVVFLPGSLELLYEYMERHPEVGVCGPLVTGADGALQATCRPSPTLGGTLVRAFAADHGRGRSRVPPEEPHEVEVMTGCLWFVRREALEEVGPLDERFFMYSEDMDWCRRFRSAGWKIVCVPDARILHYGGGSSSLAPVRFYLEMRRANLQYWQKYHTKTEQRLFILVTALHQMIRYAASSAALVLSRAPGAGHRRRRHRSLMALRWLFSGSRDTSRPVDPRFWDEVRSPDGTGGRASRSGPESPPGRDSRLGRNSRPGQGSRPGRQTGKFFHPGYH